MKKQIILGLLIIFAIQVMGQKEFIISGRIIDKETKEPLPYTTIVYIKKSLGTISNNNGYFTLSLKNALETDSIIISYMGYKTLRTVISECTHNKIFKLEPYINKIPEVVIKAKKFKLKAFIKTVINNYNKNRRNEPHIAIAYYKEKAKNNGKYIMYMESIGYSVFSGKQTDAAPLSNYKFFYENTKCHVVNPQWIKYKKNLGYDNYQTVRPAGSSNLNIFRYIEIYGLLSNNYYKKYNYKIDSSYFINKLQVYCINFNGDEYKGSIHIFAENKQILKIECTSNRYWSTAFNTRLNAHVNIKFNYFGETPFISLIESKYSYAGLEHYNTLRILLQKFNKFKLSADEYWSLDEYDINPFIEYIPQKWKDYIIKEDGDYEVIKADLQSNGTSLEKQFLNYSGRWFFPNAKKSELAKSKIKELKNNF